MPQTLEQIRREGLAALRERLGKAGLVRFLQQFDSGAGDYARERHAWVDRTAMTELRKEARTLRRSR
jgi:hypothetical protein